MSDYPAGWYDDPKTEGQERYWDGEGWTHDVRQAFAEGWYTDPDRFGFERHWDGQAWTDDRRPITRLDELLPAVAFRKKEHRLVVSGDELRWGDDSIRWDQVTEFDSVIRLDNRRLPGLYQITANGNGAKFAMELVADRGGETRMATAFNTIIDQARRIVVPRILNDLFKRADAGEVVEYKKLVLSPQGFAKGARDTPIPWTEYGGWRALDGGYIEIDRIKGEKTKRDIRVRTTQLERWVLIGLLDDYSRRLSGGG